MLAESFLWKNVEMKIPSILCSRLVLVQMTIPVFGGSDMEQRIIFVSNT
jgi:hypothetical protein